MKTFDVYISVRIRSFNLDEAMEDAQKLIDNMKAATDDNDNVIAQRYRWNQVMPANKEEVW